MWLYKFILYYINPQTLFFHKVMFYCILYISLLHYLSICLLAYCNVNLQPIDLSTLVVSKHEQMQVNARSVYRSFFLLESYISSIYSMRIHERINKEKSHSVYSFKSWFIEDPQMNQLLPSPACLYLLMVIVDAAQVIVIKRKRSEKSDVIYKFRKGNESSYENFKRRETCL